MRAIEFNFDKSKKTLVGPITSYKITDNYGFDYINTFLNILIKLQTEIW
ncbi:MAG: hypothetical protein WBH31_06490 [Promethearchaeia archaeon]